MDCLFKKRCEGKRQVKNSILDGPLIVNLVFSNILLPNQILLILCIFIKQNVWYSWSLKILVIKRSFPCNFAKILEGCHFVVGRSENFKLLADILFESNLQNIVLSSLLLLLCACYEVHLDHIQWNEVAAWTARDFNNSWPIYLMFSNMKIPNVRNFFFEKGAAKKKQFFHIFKGPSFRKGWLYWYECWRVLRDFLGFLKSLVLQNFPKYSQSNFNLNAKSRAKFNFL